MESHRVALRAAVGSPNELRVDERLGPPGRSAAAGRNFRENVVVLVEAAKHASARAVNALLTSTIGASGAGSLSKNSTGVSVRCWVSFPRRTRGLILARDVSITNAWS